jgi:hypothetical protein
MSDVKDIVSKYIDQNPKRITLYLYDDKSLIEFSGSNFNEKIELDNTVSFTGFAHGVLAAYKDRYGELRNIPVSFREEIYKNDKVSLHLYPTGSAGIFDIFVDYF